MFFNVVCWPRLLDRTAWVMMIIGMLKKITSFLSWILSYWKLFWTVLTHIFAEFGVFILGVHVSQFKPPVVPTDIDPFPLFMEDGVQTILNDITGIDLKKTALLQPKKLPLKPVLRAVPDKELKRVIVWIFTRINSKEFYTKLECDTLNTTGFITNHQIPTYYTQGLMNSISTKLSV